MIILFPQCPKSINRPKTVFFSELRLQLRCSESWFVKLIKIPFKKLTQFMKVFRSSLWEGLDTVLNSRLCDFTISDMRGNVPQAKIIHAIPVEVFAKTS